MTAGTDYQTPLVAGTDYQTPLVADTDYLTPGTASSTYQAAGSYLTEETDPVAMEALSALTTIDTSTGTLSDVITAVNAIILAFGGSAPA